MRAQFSSEVPAPPLTPDDLRELRAAARPGGLRLSLACDLKSRRLERLDRLNQRRLLAFHGLTSSNGGSAEIRYAISESGRKMFDLN